MKGDKASFPAKTVDEMKTNSEVISVLQNEDLLKYSSEMVEGLMPNKVVKSYMIAVYETIAIGSCQMKIPS